MLAENKMREIEHLAKKGEIARVVSWLVDILGQRITIVLVGRKNASILRCWMGGGQKPTEIEELRLRYGYWAAKLIEAEYGAETARAMFIGSNSTLSDEAPCIWLANHETDEDLKEVLTAALSFGEMGA